MQTHPQLSQTHTRVRMRMELTIACVIVSVCHQDEDPESEERAEDGEETEGKTREKEAWPHSSFVRANLSLTCTCGTTSLIPDL